MPLGPLRRLGLAPVGLLASSLGLASLGLRLNLLSSADRVTRRSVSVAGTVAVVASASSRGEKSVRFRSRVKFAATKKSARRKGALFSAGADAVRNGKLTPHSL